MKKIYISICSLILCCAESFAQVTFVINGSNGGGVVNDVKQTYDPGYIFVGTRFLLKTNLNGDTIWTNGYTSGLYYLGGASVYQTADSGYIDVGGTGIIKTNSSGNPLWSKNYAMPSFSLGCPAIDSGYILAGTTSSVGAGGDDIFLIKTDSAGNPIWSKAYGGTDYDEFGSLQQTSDGGYIIAGGTGSFSGGAYVIKINSTGDTLWSKTYNVASQSTGFNSVQQSYDGGYIMAGGINGSVYFVKTDSTGNLLWSKSYGDGVNPFVGISVQQTSDSGYVISGDVAHTSSYSGDVLLMKTDKNGNALWCNAWSSGGSGFTLDAKAMYRTRDSGYIMAVEVDIRNYVSQFIIYKTDANGNTCGSGNYTIALTAQTLTTVVASVPTIVTAFTPVATSDSVSAIASGLSWGGCLANSVEALPRKQNPITIYPNPVAPDGCINISLNEDLNGAELTIYSIMGEVLYSQVANGSGRTILLSLKGKLSTGMYFLRIKQGEKMCVQKIVVMG